MAAHGDKMIDVFKGMSAAAKATGIEVSALLQIAGQFDTFEGAAQAAGNLNAILGGDLLNSVELLAATEEERIRMLIQSIQLSGKSWESMNKFERQAIASAAGITDMAQAGALFNQSLSAYDEQVTKADASAISQEKMNEMMKEFMSIGDKLKALMMSFAISMGPVITGLKHIADAIITVVGTFTWILSLGDGIVATFVAIAGAVWLLVYAWGALTLATITTGAKLMIVAGALWLIGKYILEPMHSPALYIGIFILAAGIFAVGKAAEFSAAGLFILAAVLPSIGFGVALLGAGIALVGAGVFLAATGMAKLVEAMSLVDPLQVLATAAALSTLGFAMMQFAFLGVLGPVVGGVLLLFTAMMIAAVAAATPFNVIAQSIRDIGTAINEVSALNLGLFTIAMMGAAVAAPALAVAALPVLAAAGVSESIIKSADRGVTSKATPASAGTVTTTAGGSTGEAQPIIMKVKDRVLAEIIKEQVKPMIDSAMSGKRISPNDVSIATS